MKEKLIKVVLKRFPSILLEYSIVSKLYDELLKESSYSTDCGMDKYYYNYFELSKKVENYIIEEIRNGNEEYQIGFIYDNNYLINLFLSYYEVYNDKNALKSEQVLFNTIEEYDSNELYSIQVIRNLKQEFIKPYVKSKK